MRVLVCGSRHFDDWKKINSELEMQKNYCRNTGKLHENGSPNLTIIQGGATGADFLAKVWAKANFFPFEEYPAKWEEYGKSAGSIRNKQMLVEGKPDMVIAFLAPDSRGTKNMIEQATKAGVPVKIINI